MTFIVSDLTPLCRNVTCSPTLHPLIQDVGAVNFPRDSPNVPFLLYHRVLSSYFCVTVWKYDSYQLGQDQLCSIKHEEALFKDTADDAAWSETCWLREEKRERAGVSRQRRASGLNSPSSPRQPNIGAWDRLCQFGVSSASGLCTLEAGDHWGRGGVSTLRTAAAPDRRDIADPGSRSGESGRGARSAETLSKAALLIKWGSQSQTSELYFQFTFYSHREKTYVVLLLEKTKLS